MGDRSTFGPRWSRDGFWEGILQYRADSRPGILTPRDTLNISKFASRGGSTHLVRAAVSIPLIGGDYKICDTFHDVSFTL